VVISVSYIIKSRSGDAEGLVLSNGVSRGLHSFWTQTILLAVLASYGR